jgi:hypothetical protein
MPRFKSPCGYNTDVKYSMIRHIATHKCTDLKILGIEVKNRENLDHLTDEEKLIKHRHKLKQYKIDNKELIKQQQHKYDLKKGFLGAQNEIQFASQILKHMKSHSKTRNHKFPDVWDINKVIELLRDNRFYKVETDIGIFEFPMVLTNGFYNSASIDRIDDDKGYELDNIEIRPTFLNSRRKLTTDTIKQISVLRKNPRTVTELDNIINLLKIKPLSNNFFYECSRNARRKKTLEKRNLNFDFTPLDI